VRAYLTEDEGEESCEITAIEWCPRVEVLHKKEKCSLARTKQMEEKGVEKRQQDGEQIQDDQFRLLIEELLRKSKL